MGPEKIGREKIRRLMRMTVSFILLATVAVAPASARRQKSEEAWDNLKKLQVGEEIQVVYQDEQYLNGRFLGFTPDAISVQWGTLNRHDETVPRREVIRVITSRPGQRVKNILAGVGVGALMGGYFAAMSGRKDEAIGALAAGVAIGAMGGALMSPDMTIYQARRNVVLPELKRRRSAQPTRKMPRNPSWDNLHELHGYQEIRVLDQDLRVYNGRLDSVSDEHISFRSGGEVITLERDRVLEVSIERSRDGWTDITEVEWDSIYTNSQTELPQRDCSIWIYVPGRNGCGIGF